MWKIRILILLAAVILTVLLFKLPRVVVDNEESSIPGVDQGATASTNLDQAFIHDQNISTEDQQLINSLKAKVGNEGNIEKTPIFADSLAQVFLKYQKYDSAATYFERAAKLTGNERMWINAGNAYYEAFTYAVDKEEADFFARKVRECLQPVVDEDPERLDLKTMIGMTWVSSSNPMQGITLLREVLEKDPDNQEALYNLGILAFQTGQFQTSIDRFERLVESHENNVQAHFYLGLSYLEIGETEKAKEQLMIVKKLDKSPEVQSTVDSYLNDIE